MLRLTESEILQIVHKLGIKYTDHGDYIKFSCINPAHSDKNPSMTMIKANGYTRCWSCGATYNFSMFVNKVGRKKISDFVNINKHDRNFLSSLSSTDVIKKFERNAERELKIISGEFLNISHNLKVKKFLESINIFEPAIEKFHIQYVEKAEITFKPHEEEGTKVYNRIVIPIVENGKLINMECRDYTGKQQPKVLYPRGSKADILWNYDNLDFDQPLVVVEGIKSALRIWQFGTQNVTATLGSGLGKAQKQLISRIKHLILFPDNDKAGLSMISQVDAIMERDYKIAMMKEDGQDPADGSIDNMLFALNNPIESYDNWLKNHGIHTQKRRVKWI